LKDAMFCCFSNKKIMSINPINVYYYSLIVSIQNYQLIP